MLSRLEEQKQSILASVLNVADTRLAGTQRDEARSFIGGYYEQVDAEDMLDRSVDDLYGAAMAHLFFGRVFASGTPKLRIYNPSLDEHGWTSPHTVIEIVNDDMPFLVDSAGMEINRQGGALNLLIHPLFRARRDAKHRLEALLGTDGDGRQESFMHVEIGRETDPARLKALEEGLLAVLADVRAVVGDWQAMRARMSEALAELGNAPATLDTNEVAEVRAFLAWLNDQHFTFIGYREYELIGVDGEDQLRGVPRSGLGVLRAHEEGALSAGFRELPASIRKLAREPKALILTKANTRATVHRPGYLDYIGVKRFDDKGNVTGERRFVGLYTSSAYHERPRDIPLLRYKVASVVAKAGFPPASHLGKSLVTVLETYPRDELFQVDEQTLLDTALGILRLGDRRKTRVFMRRDVYGRFYSCLIYVPRENFNTELRLRIQDILKRACHGSSVEFTVHLSEAVLARLHMLVRTPPGDVPVPDTHAIEADIEHAMRRWEDDLQLALGESSGEAEATRLLRIYGHAFPFAYRDNVSARSAVRDISMMEGLSCDQPFAINLYRPVEAGRDGLRLRVLRLGEPVPLSGSLPMLENMGVTVLDEQSYAIERAALDRVHIHDFGLRATQEIGDIETLKPLFEEAFGRVWQRETESDGFNRLVLAAGLGSDDIVVLRAYAKYLKQIGFTFSQAYIEQTLAGNAKIARLLADLFNSRFDPAKTGDAPATAQRTAQEIETALDAVANADEDRILRRLLALIQATLRTNRFQRDNAGRRKRYVSFKLASRQIPELPEPRPLYEIWVYSPRVEGIHLRGGKVARGGLRWSDRMEDFRTEVLGLVKAQMVKNAVIVPVGSKGGFVVKNPPPATDREATLAEGIACYRTFLHALLDLTDNLVAGKVVPPRDVVRHDDDDPYLVVAADKGTAAFSDIANAVSAEYGFWLGDAFASGGSVGYDHKKMGITAKGAWESVKRHFRWVDGEGNGKGIDTQATDFTVVGIGDMSGDVFGNGMLLSRHIKLVAAFDHRHIFLDPDPDPESSFRERERLFNLPRSSWDDYDKSLISRGGGVYARSSKTLAIGAEVKRVLDIAEDSLTPSELLRAILKAPVDLFYNGGIGTYVKASRQSNAEVGDRANDAIRVNGSELRCKVVAEGGNLGFTQLGRVEFALKGGCINTDAIDNSAGVDCSDHEVNIKILLGLVQADGELTEKQRNKLLAEMTSEVAELVLADNYYQTQSLAISGVRAEKLLNAQMLFMRHLEKLGRLNRAVEFLPSDDVIAERRAAKAGLTSPERAVLLAYSKMALYDELTVSELVDDPYVAQALADYFPGALAERYRETMARHPLMREIIATVVTNTMINHVGSVFVHRMQQETGAAAHEVARAYILVRDIFGFTSLWSDIEALDNRIPARVQAEMLIDAGRLLLRATLWFLRRRREKLPIADVLKIFRPGADKLRSELVSLLNEGDLQALRAQQTRLEASGVPAPLAERVAGVDALYAALDIVEAAAEQGVGVDLIARIYFVLAGRLELRWLAAQIAALPAESQWQAQARNALRDDLTHQQRLITARVAILSPGSRDARTMIEAWLEHNALPLARLGEMVQEFKTGPSPDLAMLSVVLRELRGLT